MVDMSAIERQLADESLRIVGPARRVDDLAVFESITVANRQKGWGVTMFSALKFVVASVIVVLFGGYLLASMLPAQHDDVALPAAVTASPAPMTTEELLLGMDTEEVEPGVFRIIMDGVRDLSSADIWRVVVGRDGSIWLPGSGDPTSLGASAALDAQLGGAGWLADLEITSDGTVWAVVADEEEAALRSFDGQTWTTHAAVAAPFGPSGGDVEITPSGKVWAALKHGTLGHLGAEGSG